MDVAPAELVRELVMREDWPEPSLLAAILKRGQEAGAPLLRFLNEQTEEPTRPLAASVVVAWLLGELHAPEAVAPTVRLFRQHDLEGLLDDLVDALWDMGPASLEPALGMLRDTSLSYLQRTRAADVAVLVAHGDPLQAERIKALLRGMLHALVQKERVTRDEHEVATSISYDLIELRSAEDQSLIEEAMDADVADPYLWDVGEAEDAFEGRGETLLEQRVRTRRPFLQEYRRNYPDRLRGESWAGWYESEQGMRAGVVDSLIRAAKAMSQTIGPPRGLGRNDPCWCGSGHKYKHCHWLEDQQSVRS